MFFSSQKYAFKIADFVALDPAFSFASYITVTIQGLIPLDMMVFSYAGRLDLSKKLPPQKSCFSKDINKFVRSMTKPISNTSILNGFYMILRF